MVLARNTLLQNHPNLLSQIKKNHTNHRPSSSKLLFRASSYHLYANPLQGLLYTQILNIIGVIFIYLLWTSRKKIPTWFSTLGQSSLYIYIGHILFIDVIRSQKLEYQIEEFSRIAIVAMPFLLSLLICFTLTRKGVKKNMARCFQFPF